MHTELQFISSYHVTGIWKSGVKKHVSVYMHFHTPLLYVTGDLAKTNRQKSLIFFAPDRFYEGFQTIKNIYVVFFLSSYTDLMKV